MTTGSLPAKTRSLVLLAIGLAFTAFNIARAVQWAEQTGYVFWYWARFWLVSYSDGYVRRGLLGQMVRLFAGEAISVVTLNVLALVVALTVLALVYRLFFSRVGTDRHWIIVFVVVISGPATTLFFEVLGDPLQVALLCVIAYLLLAPKLGSGAIGRLAAVATALTVVLIHEASIFLLVPAVYLIFCLTTGRRPRYPLLAVVMIALTAITVALFSIQEPTSAGLALVTRDGTRLYPSGNVLPPFFALLRADLGYYFGSAVGPLRLALKLAGSFLWPVLVVLAAAHIVKVRALATVFFVLLLPSLPLYVIAHDWGRFAIYTLVLSLAVTGRLAADRPIDAPTVAAWASETGLRLSRPLFGTAVSALWLMLVFQSHANYRIDGLTLQSVVATMIVLTVFGLSQGLSPDRASGDPAVTEGRLQDGP